MRGQVSVEYLIIVGFALGILLPAIFFFYKYSQTSESVAASAQLNEIGLNVIAAAKATYSLGVNARQTVEFSTPSSVKRIYVQSYGLAPQDYELVILYDTPNGQSEAVFFSPIPLVTTYPDGNISTGHPGNTRYRLESMGTSVNITEVVT